MVQRILMIEDDQRLAGMVVTYLNQNGYEVAHADTARAGLAQLRESAFALVLLDLIVMLTAKGDPLDRVIGLELGADDYLPKPFEPRELLARLRAVLRRPALETAPASHGLQFGRLVIDPGARSVRVDGQERNVTSYQFDLLLAMAERAGRVLSRDQLIDAVKGEPLEPFDRSIDVHMGRLRAAIEDDPKQPKRIITVRGAGYVFAKVQDA